MKVHVLLYEVGTDNEGIHSIELNGKTIVLMFEDKDDAERYVGLLEAQDFPTPTIELLDQEEMNIFCENSGYESRIVIKGFVPETEEDKLLLVPPENNRETSTWQSNDISNNETLDSSNNSDLEAFRKKLEGLI